MPWPDADRGRSLGDRRVRLHGAVALGSVAVDRNRRDRARAVDDDPDAACARGAGDGGRDRRDLQLDQRRSSRRRRMPSDMHERHDLDERQRGLAGGDEIQEWLATTAIHAAGPDHASVGHPA